MDWSRAAIQLWNSILIGHNSILADMKDTQSSGAAPTTPAYTWSPDYVFPIKSF